MKIALITANIGGIDEIHAPVKQKEDYEFIYITENTLPFPLPNFNNRMKGKYFKTQPHTFLDHDIFIWLDSSVEIIDGTFITWVKEKLKDHEFVCSLHPERDNVYDEIAYITTMMSSGNKYLLERYAGQPFEQEKLFYVGSGMFGPLYNGWFYATRNNHRVNKVLNEWWELIVRYTNFDQTQLSFVLWSHNVKVNVVDTSDYLVRHKHK